MTELAEVRNAALEAAARELYSERLPYHNFVHVEDTLAAAATIIQHCRLEHVRIQVDVVYYALLFHDAGYHDDHRNFGFATKERYAAALAEPVLRRFGVSVAQLEKTVLAILATERDGVFVTAEQKAARAADLSGLAADYPRFLDSSLRLKAEYELLHATTLSWPAWQANSRDVLTHYLSQDIRLTSYYHNASGESAFHRGARENLARLMAEPREPRRS